MTWRGEMGIGERLKREGMYVYLQPIQADMCNLQLIIIQQKPTQQCKVIMLQLKIKKE